MQSIRRYTKLSYYHLYIASNQLHWLAIYEDRGICEPWTKDKVRLGTFGQVDEIPRIESKLVSSVDLDIRPAIGNVKEFVTGVGQGRRSTLGRCRCNDLLVCRAVNDRYLPSVLRKVLLGKRGVRPVRRCGRLLGACWIRH